MKQMTIRNFDPEVEAAIDRLSRERQWSVNQVATYLLRKGLGLTVEAKPQLIGDRLDPLWNQWSREEVQKFDESVEESFGQIDEENWK